MSGSTAIQRRVRAALKARRIKSQNQLARNVGITSSYLSMILTGSRNPSLRLATLLEEHTGIPAREFAQEEVHP